MKLLLLLCLAGLLAGCTTPEQHFVLSQTIMSQDRELTAQECAQLFYHLEQAARADNPEACYILANLWLEQSPETPQGSENFVRWLTKAAELGMAEAQYQLGVHDIHSGRAPAGLAWLERAARNGSPEWQMQLSRYYCCSPQVSAVNLEKSFYWAMQAARQELAEAQAQVGYCYSVGQGVAKDSEQAFYWMEKAAQAGDENAQNNLGISYEYGQGTEVDFAQAIHYFEQALAAGLSEAGVNLAVLYIYDAPKPYYDPEKGFALLQNGVAGGDARAMSVMGECYQFGVGVKRDLKQALYWQNKAHEEGYYIASYYLGRMYLEGAGVARDVKLAYQLFRQSAEKESWGGASCTLGDIYLNGALPDKGKDYQLALNWYTRAARQKNQRAMYQLGYMYENGLGVSKNRHTALGWYEKALSLTALELRASYTEQSLSKDDPVARTTRLAKRGVARLDN